MKVFVSNKLEALADLLKGVLFQGGPLARRWVIVPGEQIRQALLLRWAQDEELKVAMGIKLITWSQAMRQIFPYIPSQGELALKIEKALQDMNDKDVRAYLHGGGSKRKVSFCHYMSGLFLQYLTQERVVLQGWQQTLWEAVFDRKEEPLFLRGDVYLFHCTEMTSFQRDVFRKMGATIFLFSPCALYWGDLQTEREQRYLLRQTQEPEELLNYFKNDHPLLGNWGKRGRELLELLEEEESFEVFHSTNHHSLLTTLQEEMLQLSNLEKTGDPSIEVHSAVSRMQEVEVVWELIQQLPFNPSEILVLVPNLQIYASAIELVFQHRGGPFDCAIWGVQAQAKSSLIQGFKVLLTLPSYRFSREVIEKLLSCSPFLNRFKFNQEDVRDLKKWFSEFCIRYDLSSSPNSWHAGLERSVVSLALGSGEMDFTDADLLSRWIEVIQLMERELKVISQEMTVLEWSKSLKHLAETFFLIENDEDYLIRELDKLKSYRVEGSFSYASLEPILLTIFEKKSGVIRGSHLQAVKFVSLEQGSLMPAKVLILMGMEEESFPRQEVPSSLQQLKLPSTLDADRYLFLEAVCHARQKLILTYTSLHPEDGKSQKPSPLLEELINYCHLTTTHHSPLSLGTTKTAFIEFPCAEKILTHITTEKLKKLARHPLQYFFEERLGIDFGWEERETEFNFSPLEMARLRKDSLQRSLQECLDELFSSGKLPVGTFSALALSKIKKEIEVYHEALQKFSVTEVLTLELRASCEAPLQIDQENWVYPALRIALNDRTLIIEGKIDNFSSKGLLVHGEDHVASRRRIWPLFLIVKQLYPDLPLLFTKKGKIATVDLSSDALVRYLHYAEKALMTPSPLFPQKMRDDTIVQWASRRNLLPDSWEESWEPYFKEHLHELV